MNYVRNMLQFRPSQTKTKSPSETDTVTYIPPHERVEKEEWWAEEDIDVDAYVAMGTCADEMNDKSALKQAVALLAKRLNTTVATASRIIKDAGKYYADLFGKDQKLSTKAAAAGAGVVVILGVAVATKYLWSASQMALRKWSSKDNNVIDTPIDKVKVQDVKTVIEKESEENDVLINTARQNKIQLLDTLAVIPNKKSKSKSRSRS